MRGNLVIAVAALLLAAVASAQDRRSPSAGLSGTAALSKSYDHGASLTSYQALLDDARQGRVEFPSLAGLRARLGMAQQLDVLGETDRAIDELRTVVSLKPGVPRDALGRAELQIGQAYDRLGDRTLAVSAYRAAIAAGADGPPDVRERAAAGLHQTPDAKAAEAYRLSLIGWRALERGALADAAAALDRSLQLRPGDFVTRLRRAQLLGARHDRVGALGEFEALIAARPGASVLGSAYFEAGRLLERDGQRARAMAMYRAASELSTSDSRVRESATKALATLRAGS